MKKRKIAPDIIDPYKKNSIFLILLRYFILLMLIILLLFPLSNPIIYTILTPLTIYPVIFLLKFFVNVTYVAPLMTLGEKTLIQIVPACIAGAAYILILILNLSVRLKAKTRINSLLLSLFILLVFNILRIFSFALLYHNLVPYTDLIHKIFWYIISTFFIIGIWFFIVKIFKIKEIPFYSDISYIIKEIKGKR